MILELTKTLKKMKILYTWSTQIKRVIQYHDEWKYYTWTILKLKEQFNIMIKKKVTWN